MNSRQQAAGLHISASLIIDAAGNIQNIVRPEFSSMPELETLSPGQHLDSLFPNLIRDILTELPANGNVQTSCFLENLGDRLIIITVNAMPDREQGYSVLLYPDTIGLGRLYDRSQRIEIVSRSLYESSLDAIITINGESLIYEFGNSAEQLFGYQRNEVIGKNVADIIIPPKLRQAHHDGMARFHDTHTGPVLNTRVEVQAMRRDGSIFPCELTVVPTQPINGETYFTATVRDISERRAHEAALKKAREVAEASNAAKTRFLAHMSHEIRSPMNAVLGCMDLLLDSDIDTEQKSLVETSLSAGSGLLGIIDDILDFSKIEAGEFKSHLSEVALAPLCEQVVDVITVRAGNKNIDIAAVLDPALPNTVLSDISFLRRILTNLLDNAVKFTHEGGVCLSVLIGDIDLENNHADIIFEVRDTGIGIAEDKQQQLFQEFSQVDSSDTTDYGGTGLGLAICKKLIEQLDGHIQLHSRQGEGCTFRIVMPFKLPAGAKVKAPTMTTEAIAVVSSNRSFSAAICQQAALWGRKCQCVSRIEDVAEAALVIIDISQITAAPHVLARKCREHGLPQERIALYAPAFSTDSVLSAASVGFTNILHRPLKPSILTAELSTEAAATEPSDSLPSRAVAGQSSPSSEKKLLLAEDNKANQLVAKTMLERAGYQLDIVENGRQALDAAQTGDYRLILMDLRMPELDGIEACKRIRALDSEVADIPIIAMTANAFESDVERCLDAGMNDFIAKPVDRQRLVNSLQKWLGQSHEGEEAAQPSAEPDEVIMDLDVAQQLLDDTSPEAVVTIMTMVLDELTKLSASLGAMDGSATSISALREAAHSSKSSAGYCGAVQLQQFCQELELACDLLDHEQLQVLIGLGEQRIADGRRAISNYIATLS